LAGTKLGLYCLVTEAHGYSSGAR